MLLAALVEARGFRALEAEFALDFGYFIGKGYEFVPLGVVVRVWVALTPGK